MGLPLGGSESCQRGQGRKVTSAYKSADASPPRHRSPPTDGDGSHPEIEVLAVLAVVRRGECAGRNLLAPDDPACLLRVRPEEGVTLGEVPVDGRLASLQ